jgi:hypothetical protein
MRTKTLLLTAVLGVAGVASTMAQSGAVYSQNTVGYVTLNLPVGFSLIANPLNATTNDLNSILTNVPAGTIVYTYSPTGGYAPSTFRGGVWHPDQNLNPGSGAFILLTAASTVTFVGQVPTGSLSQPVPVGFSLQAIPIPVSVNLDSTNVTGTPLLTPGSGDVVYEYENATGYTPHTYRNGAFHTSDFAPAVGQGFFYLNNNSAFNWNVTFNVN